MTGRAEATPYVVQEALAAPRRQWSAVLILAVGLVIDLVITRLDPRIRRAAQEA